MGLSVGSYAVPSVSWKVETDGTIWGYQWTALTIEGTILPFGQGLRCPCFKRCTRSRRLCAAFSDSSKSYGVRLFDCPPLACKLPYTACYRSNEQAFVLSFDVEEVMSGFHGHTGLKSPLRSGLGTMRGLRANHRPDSALAQTGSQGSEPI